MRVYALSDPHLPFGAEDKNMDVFGPAWKDYTRKIEENWLKRVKEEDLVLLAGDISWAMSFQDALIDLQWIDRLPGTKVMIKGNHDYWWASSKKMQEGLPPSIKFIYNSALHIDELAIGGARLWDTHEYEFSKYTAFQENPREKKGDRISFEEMQEQNEKIFTRELERLELSLKLLNPKAKVRIAMTHYPPIGADLEPSRASRILEQYQIDFCIFGHLHSIHPHSLPFGKARGVNYLFTSCDYLDFKPLPVL